MVIIKRSSRYTSNYNKWLLLLVSMAVVVGIGYMGSAAALWGDSIYLDEDVDTGYLDVAIQNPGGYFEEAWHLIDLDPIDWGVPFLSDPSYAGATGCPQLYPDENTIRFAAKLIDDNDWIYITFKIKNKGTVPVKVDPAVIGTDDGNVYVEDDVVRYKTFTMSTWIIDPGSTATGTIGLKAHEGHWGGSRYCDIPIKIIQWNGDFSSSSGLWSETLYVQGTLNG